MRFLPWRRPAGYGPFLDKIKFASLTNDDGMLNLKVIEEYDEDTSKSVLLAMTVSLIRMMGQADNYVEMVVRSGRVSPRDYLVRVQRAERPTPHQLRQDAEQRLSDLREAIDRLADSIHGDSGWEHNAGCEGEPDCLACIVADLRRLYDTTATGRTPA